jgi:hypothetical protein
MMGKIVASSFALGFMMACDTMPGCEFSTVASVTVSVVDPSGVPVAPESVTFSVDGSADAACESLGVDGSEFICGWEVDGDFVITVAYLGDQFSDAVTVGMSLDGCHVQSEFVEIEVN